MLIDTVTENTFHDAFHGFRDDDFSYAGRKALYSYLYDLSEDIGQPIELDVIALCCDYCEYADFEEIQEEYSNLGLESLEDLEQHTTVIAFPGGIIIQQF